MWRSFCFCREALPPRSSSAPFSPVNDPVKAPLYRLFIHALYIDTGPFALTRLDAGPRIQGLGPLSYVGRAPMSQCTPSGYPVPWGPAAKPDDFRHPDRVRLRFPFALRSP